MSATATSVHTESRTEFSVVLRATFRHGDITSVANWLRLQPARIHEWLDGITRSAFECAALVTERLVMNGNPDAHAPFLALSRRLGFISIPATTKANDDRAFAAIIHDFAQLVDEKGKAESDGVYTPDERRALAAKAAELMEQAAAYRLDQLRMVGESETFIPVRRYA